MPNVMEASNWVAAIWLTLPDSIQRRLAVVMALVKECRRRWLISALRQEGPSSAAAKNIDFVE
ncbi:hypothetical protein [Oryzomonas rubra]|uniref:Uncharacterized protein n=1 Tax=Oryzomonas rubra TaxID=2509454 RepID=A0A5A9XQ00_9BACT|nr:hypothetical protein [Oryzomonas rubra]KAA0895156.1 hypothetical protein ET418_01150 [Oryzomonas rubra]